MNDEARLWLKYAKENREVAAMALERGLYNPCLQNAQQAVEKSLKSAILAGGAPLVKTHSIRKLRDDLLHIGIDAGLSDDDCDLFDSIYLPSKYPVGPALPRFDPDEAICRRCIALADAAIMVAAQRVQR
jgi:HEPN domain-containing protein